MSSLIDVQTRMHGALITYNICCDTLIDNQKPSKHIIYYNCEFNHFESCTEAMGKRKSGDLKPGKKAGKQAKVAAPVEEVPDEKPTTSNANTFKNKEKVLVVSARGITFRYAM